MKKWHMIPLAVLLVSLPFLSACDLFGGGNDEQEYYQQQLEAYQKVAEENRKAQEAYQKSLQEGYPNRGGGTDECGDPGGKELLAPCQGSVSKGEEQNPYNQRC